MGAVKRFGTDEGGAVAIMFGLAILPLVGLVGSAVDYSRASAQHTKLQRAVDAAAIALIREPKSATKGELEAKAVRIFAAVHPAEAGVSMAKPVVDRVDNTIVVSRQGHIVNAFMQVLGFGDTALRAEARASWGNERIELALVLDNTGSMNEFVGSKRKIDELKLSAGTLVDKLRTMATDKDDVRLSVVPFNTEVRVQPAKYRNKDWIRWDKPNDAAERAAWTGHLVDRYQPYDVRDDAPAMAIEDSKYTKRQTSEWGPLAYVQPLVSLHERDAYDSVKKTIASMEPRGNTNVGLGVSWGVATLTGSVPLDTIPSVDPRKVRRFMVVLTDGTNTQHYVNGAAKTASGDPRDAKTRAINSRTALACDMAKDPKRGATEVFTIRLLKGDVDLLQGCASPPNDRIAQHYFDVQSEAELTAAFQKILDAISGTRLTH